MPVRKIPKSYIGVTGSFASRKNNRPIDFESLLEKDYMLILEYEDNVEGFEEQPVKIKVSTPKRRNGSYVPDLLVHYRPDEKGQRRKSALREIKTIEDLKKNKVKYAPKFAAAQKFAADKDWEFKVLNEKDIRKPRLAFLKFLREYHQISPSPEDIARVMTTLAALKGRATYAELINRLCQSDSEMLATIPVVWHLVATKRIQLDLNQPISDQVRLGLPKARPKNEV